MYLDSHQPVARARSKEPLASFFTSKAANGLYSFAIDRDEISTPGKSLIGAEDTILNIHIFPTCMESFRLSCTCKKHEIGRWLNYDADTPRESDEFRDFVRCKRSVRG